jgi:hypothetical protein
LLNPPEAKGYLRHRVGGTFVYSSVENPQSFSVRAVKQIIERFCGGSAEQLVAGMVGTRQAAGNEYREYCRDGRVRLLRSRADHKK